MPRALVESTLTPLCFSFSSSFFLSGHAVHPISLLVTMPKKKQLTPAQIEVIHALYKEGTATRCIAENMGISVRTVQVWTKKIRDAGEGPLPTHKKRPGKKRLLSNRTLNAIKRQVEAKPTLTAKELKQNNPKILGDVAVRTIHDYLHKVLKYNRCRSVPKPLVTKHHRQMRVNFARQHQHWTLEQWRNVLWSDESTFTVSDGARNYVYRQRGSNPLKPQYTRHTIKHPESVMVWGCFSYHGLGHLVFLPKNVKMNQHNYLDLLIDHLDPSMEACHADFFMQDGAPCHRAKLVTEALDFGSIRHFNPWPGNSSDINPIENIWGKIKSGLQNYDVSSVPKLKDAIQQLWDSMPQTYLQTLADSLPRRLELVRNAKGYPIKY